jgi:HTH-type transcriptional regulator / antitoxin MqsA
MAAKLPTTMKLPETGETLRRDARPFVVRYKGLSRNVDLPGYYPKGAGESVHVGDDMVAADAALRELKERIDGIPAPGTIRRIRLALKLSQRAAGALFRVGPSAFDKYERGLIEPSGPTIQLLWLLSRRPALAAELRRAQPRSAAKRAA